MELIQDQIVHFQKFYAWALTRADDRVKDWLLMQSYTPTLVITALYLVAVWIGPKLMENREPVKLKWTLFFYNFGLIVMNFHIFSQLVYHSTKLGYSYSCQPVDYTLEHSEMQIAKALWWFYFSKFVEMLDTIFFIMRKKNNQVSFLHVYHHASMFPIWWIGIKWVAGGQSFFGAMINSFIHVVMYTYYGVSALGPEYQKYLWWKRYLTKLQLLQFFIGMVYGIQGLLVECDYPKWMQYSGLVYGITIISLFINFYVQAYLKKTPSASSQVQFVTGIVHAVQSLVVDCEFPEALHWALIFYAFTILLLFLNFYFHAYLKSSKQKKSASKHGVTNGSVANGGHKRNTSISSLNNVLEPKKDK